MLAPFKPSSAVRPFASSLTRFGVLSLAVAAVFVAGCDDLGAGDKATGEKVNDAVDKIASLPSLPSLAPGEGVQSVSGALTGAADSAAAGPYKALAAGAAAAVDQQAAYAGVLELKKQEAAVRRTLLDLRGLAMQVTTCTTYAAGYAKGDPKSAVTDLSGHISSMQGNAQNPAWGAGDTQTLPTIAASKQEESRLQGEVEQKQQQLADLTKKRTDTLATAEVQSKHADSLKGEEGVRAFADASESRRAAEDLSVNIDLVQVSLDRLKTDLAAAQSLSTIVNTGVQRLKDQGQALETDWGGQQKFAAGQKQIAQAAVEGDDKTTQSIKSTSVTLAKQLTDLGMARQAVLEQLNEAAKYAQTAKSEADKFSQDLAPKMTQPGKAGASYKALRDSIHPQMFQYRTGVVQRDLGAASLADAIVLGDVKATVDEAKAAIEAAGLTAPDELIKIDTSAADQLLKGAEEALKDSNETLTNVESGDSPENLKSTAKTARLITLFTHLQLYDLTAATDATAKASATQMLSDATALKDELVAANVALPPLPGPLGSPSPAAALTPVVAPATAPAAQ